MCAHLMNLTKAIEHELQREKKAMTKVRSGIGKLVYGLGSFNRHKQ